MNEFFTNLSRMKFQRIFLVMMVAAVYGTSLANDFVWDDKIFFINNPVYRDFDLRAMFFSLGNGAEYLPLRDVTYALDYLVWGKNPFGFHLTNLLFFMVNVLLVRSLAERMLLRIATRSGRTVTWFAPFIVAAGYALHPINAEAVNFVTCRNVLVSGVFFFLAVILALRSWDAPSGMEPRYYWGALLAFIGAMLGKATAIILPLLLAAIIPLLYPVRAKRVLFLLAPFFLVAAGFFLQFKINAERAGFTGVHGFSAVTPGAEKKIAIAVQIPLFYLKKLLVPVGFCVEYAVTFSERLLSVPVLVAVVLLGIIVVAVIRFRRELPLLLVGVCWFLVALLPVLNFFDTHPVVADRYVFLPLFGFMLVTAATVDAIGAERLRLTVCLMVAVFLATQGVRRSLDWRSDETLWSANIRSAPASTKSYTNLAATYLKNGQPRKATDLLSANLHVPWLSVYLDYFEGIRLLDENDLPGAKARFEKALLVVGNFVGALHYMGRIAEREGDYVTAALYYNRALNSDGEDGAFERPVISKRLEELKRSWVDRFLAELQARVDRNPEDLSARKELAIMQDRLGFYREALEQYLALEKGGVTGWQIYHNIGNCYFNMNNADGAIRYYEKAVALGGGSEDTFNNLGIAYRKLERHAKSISVLQQGVSRFPDSAYPALNLAVSYYASGQKDQARSAFAAVEQKFPEFKDRIAPYLKMLAS